MLPILSGLGSAVSRQGCEMLH
ncbi:PTPA-CTERM sorting domain-containing protein [Azospirillum sp.]